MQFLCDMREICLISQIIQNIRKYNPRNFLDCVIWVWIESSILLVQMSKEKADQESYMVNYIDVLDHKFQKMAVDLQDIIILLARISGGVSL